MARTTAPLLSFDSRGQIAKTQVYASWKGRPYARRYVVPANPKTSSQTQTRSVFTFLNQLWKFMPGSALSAWDAYANSLKITNRNAWLKANVSPLRTATDLLLITLSPSAKSGLAASAIALTPGAGQITVDLTAPALPVGWTIDSAYALAVAQQDPHSGTNYPTFSGTDATSPYSIVLTGMTAAQEYVVGGWFKYLLPDGSFAYGVSVQDVATPT